MDHLSGKEEIEATGFLRKAAEIAQFSTCENSKCGSVVVKDGRVIGEGLNSPPKNLESQRRCLIEKNIYDSKVTDKTCCVHAEQRAIFDALRKGENLEDSVLYFIRLDSEGKIKRFSEISNSQIGTQQAADIKPNLEIQKAGKPYCTICSKMALDVGISEFVLWHEEGICSYGTEEYNKISYEYGN